MNWLNDIDSDLSVNLGNRYILVRKRYQKLNYIDSFGKKITERVFSFLLYRGKHTVAYFNLPESELGKAIPFAEEKKELNEKERRSRILSERSARLKFPVRFDYVFNNVTISVVEDTKYYNKYFSEDEKSVEIYANERQARFADFTKPMDFAPSGKWVTDNIVNLVLTDYKMPEKIYKQVETTKIEVDFVPLHFYIGYAVSIDGEIYKVKDVFDYDTFGFKTDKGDVSITFEQLIKLEVVGELQGSDYFVALLNKRKYVM